jgi:hypothetical protein
MNNYPLGPVLLRHIPPDAPLLGFRDGSVDNRAEQCVPALASVAHPVEHGKDVRLLPHDKRSQPDNVCRVPDRDDGVDDPLARPQRGTGRELLRLLPRVHRHGYHRRHELRTLPQAHQGGPQTCSQQELEKRLIDSVAMGLFSGMMVVRIPEFNVLFLREIYIYTVL